MRRNPFIACGFAVALLVLAVAQPPTVSAQAAAPADQPSESPAARVVSRRVLDDGSVELKYVDGTTRIVARSSSEQALEPVAPPEWLNDPATNQAFLRAMAEYYAYRTSGLEHRRRVFEWQLFSSKVTFVGVLLLVGAGIVFAAIQFRAGLVRRGAPGHESSDGEPVTQLELATTGIKVTSPVLGVIILVISLAFFYLYLVYVYPISELV
jgi:hypothetical protein